MRSRLAFLTMEYVPGETLGDRLAEGALPLEVSLDLGRQIAGALEAAHQRGIVHRDLKPANIRTTPEGWVKVLDFGLAALVPGDDTARTGAPSAGGTPGYMSPEQCRGERVTTRSDLYSFGAVLYECLTGEPAIPGETLPDLIDANRKGEVDLASLPIDLPEALITLLRGCLEPDPDRRTMAAGSARQVLEEQLLRLRILEIAGSPDSSRPEGRTAPVRGNLPRPISSFIGRASLLEEFRGRLRSSPLATLVGPGGVGKTRTSLEIAAAVSAEFPGGCWFVDLSESTAGNDIPWAVARVLNIRLAREVAGGEVLEGAIADSFRDRQALLILDNCEHLAEAAAAFVERLLGRTRDVTILATSRQALDLPGEWEIPLQPLDLPGAGQTPGIDDLSESVRLFLDRAGGKSRSLGTDDLLLVADICRRLDGLPLAIELAARHTRALPLEEMRNRIAEGRPLSDPSARRPVRHRSLRDLVEWSYRLLSSQEQTLLRRLSVFRGGCSLESAEVVCAGGDIEGWQIYELLLRLIERSLVTADGVAFSAGREDAPPTRYRLLETIRGFAATALRTDEEECHAIESRFLDRIVAIAAVRAEEIGPTSSLWVRRIEPDYANLLQGIDLSVACGRYDYAFQIAAKTSRYWVQAGYWAEGLERLERMLEMAVSEAPGSVAPFPQDRIELLNQAGRLAASMALHARARAHTDEAVTAARALNDPLSLARALHSAGIAAWFRTEIDMAKSLFEESLGIFEECGDAAGKAVCIGNLGAVHSVQGEHEVALGYHRRFLDLCRSMSDRLGEGKVLLNLARTEMMLGRPDQAHAWLVEALGIHRQNGDASSIAMTYHHLGDLNLNLGRLEEARAHLLEAARMRERFGDRGGVASVLSSLARVERESGRTNRAARLVSGLLKIYGSGSIASLPGQRETLQQLHEAVAAELGPSAMAAAIVAGEALDLHGLLELSGGAEDPR